MDVTNVHIPVTHTEEHVDNTDQTMGNIPSVRAVSQKSTTYEQCPTVIFPSLRSLPMGLLPGYLTVLEKQGYSCQTAGISSF